jgi:hypothetical protein
MVCAGREPLREAEADQTRLIGEALPPCRNTRRSAWPQVAIFR